MIPTWKESWRVIPARRKPSVSLKKRTCGRKIPVLVTGKGTLGIAYDVKGLMDFPVEIDLPGKFSVYNSLTAIAVCRISG